MEKTVAVVVEVRLLNEHMVLPVEGDTTVSQLARNAHDEYMTFHPMSNPLRIKCVRELGGGKRVLSSALKIIDHNVSRELEVIVEEWNECESLLSMKDVEDKYRQYQLFASKQVMENIIKLTEARSSAYDMPTPSGEILIFLKELLSSPSEHVTMTCLKSLHILQTRFESRDVFIFAVKEIVNLFKTTKFASIALAALKSFKLAKSMVKFHDIDRRVLDSLSITSALERFPNAQGELLKVFESVYADSVPRLDIDLDPHVRRTPLSGGGTGTLSESSVSPQSKPFSADASPSSLLFDGQQPQPQTPGYMQDAAIPPPPAGGDILHPEKAGEEERERENNGVEKGMTVGRISSLLVSEDPGVRAFGLDKLLKILPPQPDEETLPASRSRSNPQPLDNRQSVAPSSSSSSSPNLQENQPLRRGSTKPSISPDGKRVVDDEMNVNNNMNNNNNNIIMNNNDNDGGGAGNVISNGVAVEASQDIDQFSDAPRMNYNNRGNSSNNINNNMNNNMNNRRSSKSSNQGVGPTEQVLKKRNPSTPSNLQAFITCDSDVQTLSTSLIKCLQLSLHSRAAAAPVTTAPDAVGVGMVDLLSDGGNSLPSSRRSVDGQKRLRGGPADLQLKPNPSQQQLIRGGGGGGRASENDLGGGIDLDDDFNNDNISIISGVSRLSADSHTHNKKAQQALGLGLGSRQPSSLSFDSHNNNNNSVVSESQVSDVSDGGGIVLRGYDGSVDENISTAERLITAALQSPLTDLPSVNKSIHCLYILCLQSTAWHASVISGITEYRKLLVTLSHSPMEDMAEKCASLALAVISKVGGWVTGKVKLEGLAVDKFLRAVHPFVQHIHQLNPNPNPNFDVEAGGIDDDVIGSMVSKITTTRFPCERYKLALSYISELAMSSDTTIPTGDAKVGLVNQPKNIPNPNPSIPSSSRQSSRSALPPRAVRNAQSTILTLENILTRNDHRVLRMIWGFALSPLFPTDVASYCKSVLGNVVEMYSLMRSLRLQSMEIIASAAVTNAVRKFLIKRDGAGRLLLQVTDSCGETVAGGESDESGLGLGLGLGLGVGETASLRYLRASIKALANLTAQELQMHMDIAKVISAIGNSSTSGSVSGKSLYDWAQEDDIIKFYYSLLTE